MKGLRVNNPTLHYHYQWWPGKISDLISTKKKKDVLRAEKVRKTEKFINFLVKFLHDFEMLLKQSPLLHSSKAALSYQTFHYTKIQSRHPKKHSSHRFQGSSIASDVVHHMLILQHHNPNKVHQIWHLDQCKHCKIVSVYKNKSEQKIFNFREKFLKLMEKILTKRGIFQRKPA